MQEAGAAPKRTGEDSLTGDPSKRLRPVHPSPGEATVRPAPGANPYALAYTHAVQRAAVLPDEERSGLPAVLAAAVRYCR